MKPKLYLQISEPCHEDWDKMTPAQQGRHCAACNKQVVDFSLMTDREVSNYFNKDKGSVCGRFFDHQLNKPISIPPEPKKKNWRWLAASVISLLMMERAQAQRENTTIKADTIIVNDNVEVIAGMISKAYASPKPIIYKLKGTVKDTKGQPVAEANIYESGKVIAIAGSDGKFSFKTSGGNHLVLTAKSLSYEDTNITITSSSNTRNVEIVLKEKYNQLDEVAVTSFAVMGKMRITTGLTSIVTCSFPGNLIDSTNDISILNNNAPGALKVYPNPVPKNTTTHIVIPEQGNYVAQLISLKGQVLFQQNINGTTKETSVELALPNLQAGMYLIKLINQQSKQQYTSKVIVQ